MEQIRNYLLIGEEGTSVASTPSSEMTRSFRKWSTGKSGGPQVGTYVYNLRNGDLTDPIESPWDSYSLRLFVQVRASFVTTCDSRRRSRCLLRNCSQSFLVDRRKNGYSGSQLRAYTCKVSCVKP